jgi:hypothetical protein
MSVQTGAFCLYPPAMSDAPPTVQRKQVPSRIFTQAGWIIGTFHLSLDEDLPTHLNRSEFFTLTEVKLPHQMRPLPFMALQRTATILVLPGDPSVVPEAPAGTVVHQVSCLLEGGVVMGALRLPRDLRVSDHLIGASRFFVLRDCTVGLDRTSGTPSVEAASAALVSAQRVVGVAEM